MNEQTNEVLTTKQAAEMLGIKPGTLEIWRVQGRSPRYLKIGHAVRYRKSDILEFLEKCEVGQSVQDRECQRVDKRKYLSKHMPVR